MIKWEPEPSDTDKASLVKDVANSLWQYTLLYPALNGYDMIDVMAHIAASIISDAPLDQRQAASRRLLTTLEKSLRLHDATLGRE